MQITSVWFGRFCNKEDFHSIRKQEETNSPEKYMLLILKGLVLHLRIAFIGPFQASMIIANYQFLLFTSTTTVSNIKNPKVMEHRTSNQYLFL